MTNRTMYKNSDIHIRVQRISVEFHTYSTTIFVIVIAETLTYEIIKQ